MLTPPSTPASILRRMPSDLYGAPSPTHVKFASQSLCDALRPIWCERLQLDGSDVSMVGAQSCASSSQSTSSSYSYRSSIDSVPLSVHEGNDQDEEAIELEEPAHGLHLDDEDSVDDPASATGSSNMWRQSQAHLFPMRDSIEISVSRSRAAAMHKLHGEDAGAPNTPLLRLGHRPSAPTPPDTSNPDIQEESFAVQKMMTKKPSVLNILAARLVQKVRSVESLRTRRFANTRAHLRPFTPPGVVA